MATTGSLAAYLGSLFLNLPAGISANMESIVDYARIHVANWTGQTISASGIADQYIPPILDFAKADVIDMNNANSAGGTLSIAELTVNESGGLLSAQQYRILGEMKLKAIGRKVNFSRALAA